MSSQAKVDGSTAQLDMEDPPPSLPTPPKRQKASSFTNISRTVVVLLLSLGIVIGGGIVGIAGHISSRDIQQQNAVAIIREGPDNQGKAGKTPPPVVCGSTVQCGQTFTGEVKLTEDLYCPQTTSGNCAITLEGEDAVLDCNQYMIDGDDSSPGNGICLLNGASAINCNVQKFEDGIYVKNGGEINECEVMFNDRFGIRIVNEASSTTKMKISNTYIHDNQVHGIDFFGSGQSPETSETSIEVVNVKSNNNGERGMNFIVENAKLKVKVKDSETSNNDQSGIVILKQLVRSDAAVDLELDGIISRYNEDFGVVSSVTGDVKVKGDVNLYKNGLSGFFVGNADVDVVVERRGALNSCGNLASGSSLNADIGSAGVGVATFSGNGYTCDSTSPNLSDIITCDPCPTCPSDDA